MDRRVVVTGLGILAPNGHGLSEFENAIKTGKSGIRFIPRMQELNFGCHVGGIPQGVDEKLKDYFSEEQLLNLNELLIFSGIAAIDAWKDAGFTVNPMDNDTVHWDTGAVMGIGSSDMDTISGLVKTVDAGKVKRLGSAMVERTMTSATSAMVTGLLSLGGQGTTVSSACTTGTEAIITAYRQIKNGYSNRMVAGGADTSSAYNWSGFDAMKVINRKSNDAPEKASRPMSASAGGFVPGSGAGMVVLEELETAIKRGAKIYGEVVGASLNGGGHRMGGSMTFPNPTGVQKCIQEAVQDAGIKSEQIDVINGHLTATMADPKEIDNWSKALGRGPGDFPFINSTKSMVGHCLGGAGGVEGVATLLQLSGGFIHPSINSEDLHPEIEAYEKSVVRELKEVDFEYIAKSSFGFGDVNGILIYKKWRGN